MATIHEARLAACRKRKFATYCILSLVPVARPGLGTAAVSEDWKLYYDPEWLASLSVEQAAGLILHEDMHIEMQHGRRARSAGITQETAHDWNIAGDAAINSILKSEGIPLPPDGVYPQSLGLPDGYPVEFYYGELAKRKQQKQEQQAAAAAQAAQQQEQEESNEDGDDDESASAGNDGSDDEPQDAEDGQSQQGGDEQPGDDAGGESGEDAGTEDGEGAEGDGGENEPADAGSGEGGDSGGDDASGDGEVQPGVGDGDGDADGDNGTETPTGGGKEAGKPKARPGQSGSCSDGLRRDWEDEPDQDAEDDQDAAGAKSDAKDGKCGGDESDREPKGVPQWKREVVMRQVAEAAIKQCGSAPGWFKEQLSEILDPQISVHRLLQHVIRSTTDEIIRGHAKCTYRRPSRRPSINGLMRPSTFSPLCRLAILIDTSGSMSSNRDLPLALGLVMNVINGLHLRDGAKVYCADESVAWAGKVVDPSRIELAGRGGTDMGYAMRQIVEQSKPHEKPELIILITDGETGYGKNLGVPVVACLTCHKDSYCAKRVPEWIDKICIGERY